MSNGVRWQGEPGRLLVVNYTVGLAWPAPPQTHLYNFLEGSNSSVKRALAWKWAREREREKEGHVRGGGRREGGRDDQRGFAWDSASWLHSRYNSGCMSYLLSIRIQLLAYKRAWSGKEEENEKEINFFHKQSVIVRCNNYFMQSKSIKILKISEKAYARFVI